MKNTANAARIAAVRIIYQDLDVFFVVIFFTSYSVVPPSITLNCKALNSAITMANTTPIASA